jgi:uncharacterized protein DUF2795
MIAQRDAAVSGDVRSAVLAQREHAPDEVLRWLERLPEGRYPNFEAVWEALGGQPERRS